MLNVAQTLKLRRQRRIKEAHGQAAKLGLAGALLFSLLAVMVSLASAGYATRLTRNLPPVTLIAALLDPPNSKLLQPTRIYDRSHQYVIATLDFPAAALKQYMYVIPDGQPGVNQATPYLVNALVLEFEPGFWHSPGFTFRGISEGTHPTLAQILVSELLLEDEPGSADRNLRERILAAQLTADYGRQKVLEWFLNSVQFGEKLYGADAAARVYFGKSAAQLTLAESAMLTAMAEQPYLDPLMSMETLKRQQELIIQKMLVKGLITGVEAQSALQETITINEPGEQQTSAAAFTDLVLAQVAAEIPIERFYRGGYEVISSLDADLQGQVECTAATQLARLQGNSDEITTIDDSACLAAGYLPELDKVSHSESHDLAVEVTVLDPHTGQVLALVGIGRPGTDTLAASQHPAGSILSPVLYLTAFSHGMSPASMVWDIPDETEIIRSAGMQGEAGIYHGPVSLREAFANDYPAVGGQVLQQVGADNLWTTEIQLGIGAQGDSWLTQAGLDDFVAQPVSILEVAKAYSVLANQGTMSGRAVKTVTAGIPGRTLEPASVLKVFDAQGQVVLDWTEPENIAVTSSQLAYLVSNVLSDDQARLDGTNFLAIGQPAAGKTSLTTYEKGAWVMGYTPSLVVGAWAGDPNGETATVTEGIPAGIWHAVLEYAAKRLPVEDFTVPQGISRVEVCRPSGLLPSSLCQATSQEVFLQGNEPTQVDSLYQKYLVDSETGLLATIFTPASQVEEHVFMDIPEQAEEWAAKAGVKVAPKEFDGIPASLPANNDVRISSLQMFDQVRGQVVLTGTAAGPDFSYFRLQVGEGLNPQEWLQLDGNIDTPVYSGTLGTWDTSGLQGEYSIQLMVVREDRRIDQSILQVTIDNTSPEVQVTSPQEGQKVTLQAGEKLLLSVSASDNLHLDKVDFFLDGILVGSLTEFPYALLRDTGAGEHQLLVKAYDMAGNSTEDRVTFTVIK